MHGGAKTLLVTAALATVGCAPGAKMVEIRPIADPSAKLKLGGPRLAQAKAQLALGNVGLALEAFRVVTSRAARQHRSAGRARRLLFGNGPLRPCAPIL